MFLSDVITLVSTQIPEKKLTHTYKKERVVTKIFDSEIHPSEMVKIVVCAYTHEVG